MSATVEHGSHIDVQLDVHRGVSPRMYRPDLVGPELEQIIGGGGVVHGGLLVHLRPDGLAARRKAVNTPAAAQPLDEQQPAAGRGGR